MYYDHSSNFYRFETMDYQSENCYRSAAAAYMLHHNSSTSLQVCLSIILISAILFNYYSYCFFIIRFFADMTHKLNNFNYPIQQWITNHTNKLAQNDDWIPNKTESYAEINNYYNNSVLVANNSQPSTNFPNTFLNQNESAVPHTFDCINSFAEVISDTDTSVNSDLSSMKSNHLIKNKYDSANLVYTEWPSNNFNSHEFMKWSTESANQNLQKPSHKKITNKTTNPCRTISLGNSWFLY